MVQSKPSGNTVGSGNWCARSEQILAKGLDQTNCARPLAAIDRSVA